MTLVLFYEQRARLACQVERTSDEDYVFGRRAGQQRYGFGGGMCDLSAWRRNVFWRLGPRIGGRCQYQSIRQWKQYGRHFGDGLVAERAVHNPDAASRIKSANVSSQGTGSRGIVSAVNDDIGPLGDQFQTRRPTGVGDSGGRNAELGKCDSGDTRVLHLMFARQGAHNVHGAGGAV